MNPSLSIDDVPGRHRQPPVRLPVGDLEVDSQLSIDADEILGEREPEIETRGDVAALIEKQVEREAPSLLDGTAVGRQFGRDRDEFGAGGVNPGQGDVQSIQLCDAIRSPVASEEGQHDERPRRQLR
jgi:hypothetical protein